MPNAAAATFDDDFGAFEPRRRAVPRKPQPVPSKKRKGGKGKRSRLDMTKVARVAAIGMGAAVAGGIMVNALVMQKSRHPAPLFGQTLAVPRDAAPPAAVPVKPAPAPAAVAPPAPPPVPAKPRHAAASPDKAADDKVADGDAIARLLNGGGGDKATAKSDGKAVLGIQRALAKLGFAVKPSGTFGPQTRKAIEAFEKDKHLPVKGEMSPRLVKVLSAESGMKLD